MAQRECKCGVWNGPRSVACSGCGAAMPDWAGNVNVAAVEAAFGKPEPEPRRYTLERHLTGDMLDDTGGEAARLAWERMRAEFARLAEDARLPPGAAPLWTLRWEYVESD